jgi:hypothetical protein
LQREQHRTSTANVRIMSSAHGRLRQADRVPNRVKARRRHRRAEAGQERARIEVYREGAIGETLLERDAHETVGASRDTLLRHRRPEHVLEESLATAVIHGARARRGVQSESGAPDRQVAVEVPVVAERWEGSALPRRARGRRAARRGVVCELGERARLAVLRRGKCL